MSLLLPASSTCTRRPTPSAHFGEAIEKGARKLIVDLTETAEPLARDPRLSIDYLPPPIECALRLGIKRFADELGGALRASFLRRAMTATRSI
jgi:hypothetical protein